MDPQILVIVSFNTCLSPSYNSPPLFCSLLSTCYFFLPPFNAIPHHPSIPTFTSTGDFLQPLAPLLLILCLHLPAQPLKLKNIFLSRFYPFLITCDNLPRDEENSNACQNAGPLVSFEEPPDALLFLFSLPCPSLL